MKKFLKLYLLAKKLLVFTIVTGGLLCFSETQTQNQVLGGRKPPAIKNCEFDTFQLWNKLSTDIRLKLTSINALGEQKVLIESGPGKPGSIASGGSFTDNINRLLLYGTDPVELTFLFEIFEGVSNGQPLWSVSAWTTKYDPKVNKSLYARITEDPEGSGNYIFGSQTGPLQGRTKKTESGCPVSLGLKFEKVKFPEPFKTELVKSNGK